MRVNNHTRCAFAAIKGFVPILFNHAQNLSQGFGRKRAGVHVDGGGVVWVAKDPPPMRFYRFFGYWGGVFDLNS